MILGAAASPSSSSAGSFEIELGNRQLQLSVEGAVPRALQQVAVRLWVEALIKYEVVADAADGAHSHKGKFWKVGK